MGIYSEKNKDIVTVFISGDIDEHTVTLMREYLDGIIELGGFSKFIINLSQVDFMDSTGIGMLIGRYKKLKKYNVPLCVTQLNKQTDKIFRLSGLYDIIGLVR